MTGTTGPGPVRPVAEISALPVAPAAIHFVGIGGIGMSGLARILLAWGYRVSGSDSSVSDQTEALTALGIPVDIGHGAVGAAAAAAVVVITAAVHGSNPEVMAARAAGVPVVKRADLLGLLANARRCVAVAGSHGKSTTSGMTVVALRALGADPSFAVGATIGATGSNAAPGSGDVMVVEADEYDHSFLALEPDIAIITNLEYDHPDIFATQGAYDAAFIAFAGRIRPNGSIVVAGDDDGCSRLRAMVDPTLDVTTFGETDDVDWRLVEVDGDWAVTGPDGSVTPMPLGVAGRHNARNATASLAVLVGLGYDVVAASAALATFTGVGRRFEHKGEENGVVVIDDYAHHPSEVRAMIAAARRRYPDRRIWAVFQPHTYSRTKALLDDFADALSGADQIAVLDIYAARETDSLGITAADLRAKLPPQTLAAVGPSEAAVTLARRVKPGDVVLGMGAGDITLMGPALLALLHAKSTAGGGPRRIAAGGARETAPGHPGLVVSRDSPLSTWTTWRVGGPADVLIRAATPAALRAALEWGKAERLPVTVIGGGSNLLVGDGGVRGLVILVRTPGERADDLVHVEDAGDHVLLRVAAQAPLSWVGRYACEHGWAGLDWGVGLPGTIGGATVNNAGAHGVELKDHLYSVSVVDNNMEIAERSAEWLEASYRMTRLKRAERPRPLTVVESVFRLRKGDAASLVALADDHAAFRKRTQPTGACAGSTFANPAGDFAGRLLEEAGLKGYRIGGARFSPKHANWIVNSGGATATDVRALIAHARETVAERYGIDLRPEIEEIGEP